MLCRACAESEQNAESEVSAEVEISAASASAESEGKRKKRRSEAHGESGQLCSRCGDLLGPEGMEFHARRKKSQLEKFGLAGSRRLLRKKKDGRG